MKKILSIVLATLMLLGACAFAQEAAEAFTLHNGTTFGMTMDEVRQQEAIGGFSFTTNLEFQSMEGYGTVAGQSNTRVKYYFEEGVLVEMNYGFAENLVCYETIESGLTEKYGETQYTAENKLSYYQTKRTVTGGHSNLPTSNVAYMPHFSQRIITTGDGQQILIDHYYNDYGHTLIYTTITPEQAEIMQNGANILNDL